MKKFLFISLIGLLCALWAHLSFAAKKYRYIKREHGVKFQFDAPLTIMPDFEGSIGLEGAYTYNWKGFFEFGPYFSLETDLASEAPMTYSGGLLAEYNFIKNRGKRKLIPAAGISLGVQNGDSEEQPIHYTAGAHISLKIFVGKRTPFTISLPYKVVLKELAFDPSKMTHHLSPTMGFSYYFDFY